MLFQRAEWVEIKFCCIAFSWKRTRTILEQILQITPEFTTKFTVTAMAPTHFLLLLHLMTHTSYSVR